MPLYVHQVLHSSPVWTGIGLGVFAAMNGAVLLPGGRAGRHARAAAGDHRRVPGQRRGDCHDRDPARAGAFLLALAVAGLGSGLLDVAPAAMIGDLIAGQGGTLVASYQMAGDTGSVVGPVAGGFLVDSVSYSAAFGLAAAVLIAAAVLGFISPETRPGGEAPDPGCTRRWRRGLQRGR